MRLNVNPMERASQVHTPSTVVSTDVHRQGNDLGANQKPSLNT